MFLKSFVIGVGVLFLEYLIWCFEVGFKLLFFCREWGEGVYVYLGLGIWVFD